MVNKKRAVKSKSKSAKKKCRCFELAKKPLIYLRGRKLAFLQRRKHRSFKLSQRPDYIRPVKLPGYLALNNEVTRSLWQQRKTFGFLLIFVALVFFGSVGVSFLVNQDTYSTFSNALSDEDTKQALVETFGGLGQAGLLFFTTISGGFAEGLSEVQQILVFAIVLMIWLTVVWLWRNIMAGHKVRLRDGLYNSGAPVLPTIATLFILIAQLIPLSIAIIGYIAASQTDFLVFGVDAMMFWLVALTLALISVYFFTSTFFATIIVTLPGMYPMRAIREAGDIISGRRVKILMRLTWMLLSIFFGWLVILLPIILLDIWLKQTWTNLSWLPIVPVVMVLVLVGSLIWAFSYIYFLYRKVIANETKAN